MAEHPVGILYKEEGKKITINIPPAIKCGQGDSVRFSLHPAGQATGFAVDFKPGKDNPFPGTGPIHHGSPATRPCKAKADNYEYRVQITTNDGRTIEIDPVIIVTDP